MAFLKPSPGIATPKPPIQEDLAAVTELMRHAPRKKIGTLTEECDDRIGNGYTP